MTPPRQRGARTVKSQDELLVDKLTRPLNSFGVPIDDVHLGVSKQVSDKSFNSVKSLNSSTKDHFNSSDTIIDEAEEDEKQVEKNSKKPRNAFNFTKNVNQQGTRIKKFSKKVSKLNPVNSLLRTTKTSKYDKSSDFDNGGSSGRKQKKKRGTGANAESKFLPPTNSRSSRVDSSNGGVFNVAQNNSAGRKGSVLDQVRINVSGANASFGSGAASDDDTSANDTDDNSATKSKSLASRLLKNSLESTQANSDQDKRKATGRSSDVGYQTPPIITPTISSTSYSNSISGAKQDDMSKSQIASKEEDLRSYSSMVSTGDVAARSASPTELSSTHRSVHFSPSEYNKKTNTGKSGEMDEHIKRMLSKWYFEDTLEKHLGKQGIAARNMGAQTLKKNENEIKSLQARTTHLEKRKDALKQRIEDLRTQTQSEINHLAVNVEGIGDSLEAFERLLQGRERSIKDESNREKSHWEETLQKKIKQQLEAKEEAYFDLIDQLQNRIKNLKDARSHSSSIIDGMMHRAFALAISGFGTIVSIIVGVFSAILYPFIGSSDRKLA